MATTTSSRRETSEYDKLMKYKKTEALAMSDWSNKKWLWVPHKEKGFVLGELKSEDEKGATVLVPETGETTTVPKKDLPNLGVNPPKFDGVDDCGTLGYLNEAAVFHNLRRRYEDDLIYTNSGLFLVAINPYKRIPIYTPYMINQYRGKRRNEVAPHVFAVSDEAYRMMLTDRMNQSILITGESGAGKTENTKKVIQYLADVAASTATGGTLEKQILEANPILEAFGNAKTLRNNNSSRFGKFIKMQFTSGGTICGASINSYLLEKSRVVFQAKGERTFHIFYQLLAGASAEQKKDLFLDKPESFAYLAQSGCTTVKDMDDVAEFKHLVDAMTIMAMSDKEQTSIFSIVSAILHMSNLPFQAEKNDTSSFKDQKELEIVAKLLQVDTKTLENALLRPRIKAGKEIVQTQLSLQQATYARDALCKALYGRLFLWIVKKINKTVAADSYGYFIGLLDIAGFEIFEHNTFEQLCINYTNEKLQQFFNHHMFKLEQDEYMREKINWQFIDFGLDSQETIDLIDKKPIGILAVLEEECLFPKATDETFITKLYNAHAKHPRFKKAQFGGKQTGFGLVHYAGEVNYTITGWLDKNKDPLADDIELCMKGSKNPFLCDLFTDTFTARVETSSGSPIRGGSSAGTASTSTTDRKKGAAFLTVGEAYKQQLGILMDTLNATNPHFIRCILPNHEQRPGYLVGPCVLEQLRCNGVLEGIRIARKGFPNRVLYPEFVKRYHLLVKGVTRNAPDTQAATRSILEQLKIQTDEKDDKYRFGVTKIFFRTGVLAQIEELREAAVAKLILSIQAAARGWLARSLLNKLSTQTAAAKVIQRNIRSWLDFAQWPWWELFRASKPLIKRKNFEAEMAEKDKQIADLQAKLAAEQAARRKVQDELNDIKERLDAINSDLASTKSSLEEAERARKDLEATRKDLESRLSETQGDSADRGAQLMKLQDERKALITKNDELTDRLEDETKRREELDAKRRANEASLERLQADLDAANDNVSRLERQKKDADKELADLRDNLADEQDNVSKLEGTKKSLLNEVSGLKKELDDTQHERDLAENQRKKLESLLKDKQAQLEGATAKTGDLEKAKRAGEERANDLQAELDRANQEKAALSKAKKNAEDELAAARDEAEKELASAKKSKGSVEAQLQATQANLEAETAARLAAEQARRNLETDLDAAKGEADDANAAKSRAERAKRELESKVADLEANGGGGRVSGRELDQLKKDLEAVIRDLKEKAQGERESRDKIGEMKAQLITDVADLRKQVDTLYRAKAEAERTSRKSNAEAADLKEQLEANQKDRDRLRLDRDDAVKELATLRKQMEELLAQTYGNWSRFRFMAHLPDAAAVATELKSEKP